MKKKSLLFRATGMKSWAGGIYYIKTMIYSLLQNEDFTGKFRIVALVDQEYAEVFDEFRNQIRIEINKNGQSNLRVFIRVIYCAIRNRSRFIFPQWDHYFFKYLGITAISWIPDFQHNYYPEFFSEAELNERSTQFLRVARAKNPLVLSSMSAKNDLLKYYHPERNNIHLVHFVSYIEKEIKELTKAAEEMILSKFAVYENGYICICNKFWQHKNHKVVIQAIMHMIAKKENDIPLFVFTGELEDHRNQEYINELKGLMENDLVKAHIKVLGFISRKEQIALMKNAALIIQPSLFEGWGTVLEDAKVLDKSVLLSDIPVHREQMNANCTLFDPNNPNDLCEKLEECLRKEHKSDTDLGILNMQKEALAYSKEFVRIVR